MTCISCNRTFRVPTEQIPIAELAEKPERESGKKASRQLNPAPQEVTLLEREFIRTPLLFLILVPLCCGVFGLIFGLAGVMGCREPKAKERAMLNSSTAERQ
jgi:hypothetical protein